MSQKPLERLNYFNGQRLEASDLKVEQEYHIAVRRWLNKSLYSPGIARGLEVRAAPGPRVLVSPGLALDAEGHEIILWEEQPVDVVGDARHHQGSGSDAEVEGLYLTIRYDERLTADAPCVCAPTGKNQKTGQRAASGGPSRVLARPLFAWRAFLPHESSGEVVLAQVELNDTCSEVHQINTGVRRYVGAASAAKVRQYALEGEREVSCIPKEWFLNPQAPNDVVSTGKVFFHIRGRQPNAVTLYLRGERLSSLHYTELASHAHSLDVQLAQANDGMHRHALGEHETYGNLAAHTHPVAAEYTNLENALPPIPHGVDDRSFANVLDGAFWDAGMLFIGSGGALAGVNRTGTSAATGKKRLVISPVFALDGEKAFGTAPRPHITGEFPHADTATINTAQENPVHVHKIGRQNGVDELTPANDPQSAHTHAFTAKSVGVAGAVDPNNPSLRARTGLPLTHVSDLEVWIGRTGLPATNHTANILSQLASGNSAWAGGVRLGNASDGHVFVQRGTGSIRLDFLPGVAFTEGEYSIELRVKERLDSNGQTKLPNGGRVIYNLYIE